MPHIIAELRDRGLLHESEGAKVVYLVGTERESLMAVIVQKADGGSLYATMDLTGGMSPPERLPLWGISTIESRTTARI